jgi:predicted nucleotidyltransferase
MAAPDQDSKPAGIEFYGGYQVYSENGVDLTLLRSNLRQSAEQRWRDACRGAVIFEAFHRSAKGEPHQQENKPMFDPPTIVKQLKDHGVEFVVIGGMAMIAHGSAYLTKDIDLCYHRTPSNLAALVAALAPLHPYLRGAPLGLPFRFDVPTLQAGLNFTLTTDCGDLDLLGEISGVGAYPQAVLQSQEKLMFGLPVRILSIDGLIAAKKAAGRGKDQQHVRELIELKKLLEAGGENA